MLGPITVTIRSKVLANTKLKNIVLNKLERKYNPMLSTGNYHVTSINRALPDELEITLQNDYP